MKQLLPFLYLVRWKNLLILFLTLFITAFLTLQNYFEFAIFALYTTAVLFIAAAGYALNDFFDAGIDIINRPDKLIAGKVIPLKYVLIYSLVLYAIGILSSLFLCIELHHWFSFLILVFAAAVTVSYAAYFKKKLIWGNIAVAFTGSGPVILPWLFSKVMPGNFDENTFLNYIILATFVFAWLLHFVREVVKDIEDYQGDKAQNCRSIPIVFGERYTKTIIILSISFTMILSITASLFLFNIELIYTALYLNIFVTVPFSFLILRSSKIFMREEARFAGNFIKFIMLTGLITLIVLYYEMTYVL